MNKAKYDILEEALTRIALANYKSQPVALAQIASAALREANAVIEYHISARTWYGKNGGEYKATLTRNDTGETLIELNGTTWGSDAWSYDMRNAMHLNWPGLFDKHHSRPPTIYFRDVCKVEYHHVEVSRKRDL